VLNNIGLFNLRGADIPFNPVFFSVAVVTNDSAHLFVDERKLGHDAIAHLADIKVHPYESIISWLTEFHSNAKKASCEHKVWIANSTNYAWGSVIATDNAHVEVSPIQKMKAIKNNAELEGMRQSHVCHYFILILSYNINFYTVYCLDQGFWSSCPIFPLA
jgi:Xaa-Pro aminopeptidase